MRTRLISTHFYQCKGLWRHWWNHQFCAWCLTLRHERQRWSVQYFLESRTRLVTNQTTLGENMVSAKVFAAYRQGMYCMWGVLAIYQVDLLERNENLVTLVVCLDSYRIPKFCATSVKASAWTSARLQAQPSALRDFEWKQRKLYGESRWRLPWNFDRYVLMLEANLPQEALNSLGGFMFMDDLAIVRRVALVERLFRNLPENSHFRCSLSVNHDPSTSWHNCCT